MEISGLYPMLYAFFDGGNHLRRDAVTRQVDAAIRSGADGIAVLGLGTEAVKLGRNEKRMLLDWTLTDVAARKPVAVTIAENNIPDMIEFARYAEDAGASWLILQPPRPPVGSAHLSEYFRQVAGSVSCPVGIQNAPEYLGVGLATDDFLALAKSAPNVKMIKAECSAVAAAELITKVHPRLKVFNGRAGLELTDNLRARCDGMIPGIETVDLQVEISKAMAAGNEAHAEALYAKLLPALTFMMQGLGAFVLYGKLIAAYRLGIEPSEQRIPFDQPNPAGLSWAKRLSDMLGPLP